MAGKHDAVGPAIGGALPPVYPGYRTDKAYSEGRQGLVNNHQAGTPESVAHVLGAAGAANPADQIQTAFP
jgi:hypothetical protein